MKEHPTPHGGAKYNAGENDTLAAGEGVINEVLDEVTEDKLPPYPQELCSKKSTHGHVSK